MISNKFEPRLQASARYLARLGFDAPPEPTLETLRTLQLRHTCTVTFETISTLLRRPVPIDLPSLEKKILEDGRGGYCYELNLLFLALLREVGFEARGITGRVVMGGPENAWTARTHLLILVSVNDVRYVVDVGFGRMVPTTPLRLDDESAQATPHEFFRLTQHAGQYTLRAQINGVWRAMYHFDLQIQQTVDFEIGNWYVSTHANSPLISQLVVARAEPSLRRTLNNGSYGIHPLNAASQRCQITDADELLDLLQGEFGIRLPQDLELRREVAQLLMPAGNYSRKAR